jgi:lipoprotein-anchoring transpeptidase ErfK/SrfK
MRARALSLGLALALPATAATTARADDEALPPSITAVAGTVKIRARASHRADLIGLLRPGQTVAVVGSAPEARGCASGWFAVAPRGFVCAGDQTSFAADDPRALVGRALLPRDEAYPYRYGEALGSKRFRGLAPAAETADETLEGAAGDPLLAHLLQVGAVADAQAAHPGMKLAWVREVALGEREWLVTHEGFVVAKDRVKPAALVAARSAALDGVASPFALAITPAARLAADGGELGSWPLAALVPLASGAHPGGVAIRRLGDRRLLETADGDYVDRASVSVFAARARPAGVGEHDKWVHVSINQGALTAYEGDEAVFAAAISPGMSGANPGGEHRTPPGRYRISSKHLTSDMSGPLAGGSYRTRAVPWVAYYDGGYALHGAWWHDRFGRPRSHGCINLTPADARWLFGWLEPALPGGWYAVRADPQHPGTLVLVTL